MKFWPVFLLLSGVMFAQTAADITSDTHHSLLLQNDKVRVFEVSLKPTEKTFVSREHNFLFIALHDCEVVIWSEGQSDVPSFHFNQGDLRFYFGGHAMGSRNDQNSMFRAVLVEFLSPKVTTFGYQSGSGRWEYGASGTAPPVDPHASFAHRIELGIATAKDVQLLPGDALPAPEKASAELLVAVSDLELKSADEHGMKISKSPGEVLWLGVGRTAKLTNEAGTPARFTVVEFRGE